MSTSLSPLCIPRKKPAPLGIVHYMSLVDEASPRMETVDALSVNATVTDNLSPVMRTTDELPIKVIG